MACVIARVATPLHEWRLKGAVVRFIELLRSWPGRALRVALGVSLILYGSTLGTLSGLVLMMVGMVPAVAGVAGICLIEEVLSTIGRPAGSQSSGPRSVGLK